MQYKQYYHKRGECGFLPHSEAVHGGLLEDLEMVCWWESECVHGCFYVPCDGLATSCLCTLPLALSQLG